MICSEAVLISTGVQKSPKRKPEPLKLFCLGGQTQAEFVTSHVSYDLLPELLANACKVLHT